MSLERFLKWSISERGRMVASYVATGMIGTVGVCHFLPHSIFIDYYVDFLHLYRKGFTVPLSNETKKKFEHVLDILKVPNEDRACYQPFHVVGFNTLSMGSSYIKWGARIGIPGNFEFKNELDIERSRITLNAEKIPWETESGQKLLKSLVLSENAQYYAIAKEIKMRDTPKLYIDSFTGMTCTLGTYALSRAINTRYNFYAKPVVIRFFMYTLVALFSLGNYFLIKDLSTLHYEQSIDKELKENPIFAEGGKEYYTKLLLRNMCLRNLLGVDGERLFTKLGDEKYFIRMRSTPILQRRDFFE